MKGFIVVDDVRIVGETAVKDQTGVAADTASIAIRVFGIKRDGVIVIVLAIIASCDMRSCYWNSLKLINRRRD